MCMGLFIYLFIYLILFLAALGLRCCVRAFFSCGEWGLLFIVVHGMGYFNRGKCGLTLKYQTKITFFSP